MPKITDDPAVVAAIEKEVVKAAKATKRDIVSAIQNASREVLAAEGLSKDVVKNHRAFVKTVLEAIRS